MVLCEVCPKLCQRFIQVDRMFTLLHHVIDECGKCMVRVHV